MNAAPARKHGNRRLRVLRALDITPWVRRPDGAGAAGNPDGADDGASVHACVVVLPEGCPPRELDLLGRAFAGFGATLARAPRIAVRDDQPEAAAPPARAYLVFGQAQARALGRGLSASVMNQAQIVLAETPDRIHAGGAGKRGLWMALRQLRRTLAGAGG